MTDLLRLEITTLVEWHDWLQANHDRVQGVWLVYFKPASGRTGLAYAESVEEALCWGWVDNLVRRIDEGRYCRRFVPRKPDSNWSASNRQRVRSLQAAGRMQPAGLALVEAARSSGHWKDHQRPAISSEMPVELAEGLREIPSARRGFDALTARQQMEYLHWINAASRPATRARRVAASLEQLAQGRPLGMV